MTYQVPPELLNILVDPEDKGPVRVATEGELVTLREAVERGAAKRHDGKSPSTSFEAAFLAQGGAVAYVVEEGIPVFLIDERLELDPPLELDEPIVKTEEAKKPEDSEKLEDVAEEPGESEESDDPERTDHSEES